MLVKRKKSPLLSHVDVAKDLGFTVILPRNPHFMFFFGNYSLKLMIFRKLYEPECFSQVQADPNTDVRGRMINAGIMIIDKHGKENVSLLFPIFENYLNKEVCFTSN